MEPRFCTPVVLIAEDDEDDRLLLKEAFEEGSSTKELHFVGDGVELMDYLYRRNGYKIAPKPDLILLDLNMPVMDGRQALREIKSNPELRLIPVVVFTTSSDETDVHQSYEAGANAFITKPFGFERLVSAVRILGEHWFQLVTANQTCRGRAHAGETPA